MRAIAYRPDAGTVTDRARKAEADRRVSLRPAPNTMAYLTALLPAAQAVAAYSALNAAAGAAKAAGDPRGKGQVMADTLVERVTGRATADDVDVEVGLVMDADALFGGGDTPGHLTAFGPVPAQWARDLIDPDRPRTDRPAPGWRHDVAPPMAGEVSEPTTRHTVRVTTPKGHSYDSTAPPLLPGRPPPCPPPAERSQTTAQGTIPPATPVHSPAA